MEYLRKVDFAALEATGPQDRYTQALLDHKSGADTCTINCIKVPPGGGSPAGRHTHPVEQIYYILSGQMNVEIDGQEYVAGPGSLVVMPAGVPHRNWNGGSEPVVHLALNVPLPDPNVPFAVPVKE